MASGTKYQYKTLLVIKKGEKPTYRTTRDFRIQCSKWPLGLFVVLSLKREGRKEARKTREIERFGKETSTRGQDCAASMETTSLYFSNVTRGALPSPNYWNGLKNYYFAQRDLDNSCQRNSVLFKSSSRGRQLGLESRAKEKDGRTYSVFCETACSECIVRDDYLVDEQQKGSDESTEMGKRAPSILKKCVHFQKFPEYTVSDVNFFYLWQWHELWLRGMPRSFQTLSRFERELLLRMLHERHVLY
ncbi:hypothetical protein C0J52_08716 [Blattella germanica]|nr:hypothetical protein C0J52_08716 [Blattella germanica]